MQCEAAFWQAFEYDEAAVQLARAAVKEDLSAEPVVCWQLLQISDACVVSDAGLLKLGWCLGRLLCSSS
eukprot:78315-Rhodomonas_salina.1